MSLDPQVLAARADLRVAELELLAALTAVVVFNRRPRARLDDEGIPSFPPADKLLPWLATRRTN
jgi:hypothetical protein